MAQKTRSHDILSTPPPLISDVAQSVLYFRSSTASVGLLTNLTCISSTNSCCVSAHQGAPCVLNHLTRNTCVDDGDGDHSPARSAARTPIRAGGAGSGGGCRNGSDCFEESCLAVTCSYGVLLQNGIDFHVRISKQVEDFSCMTGNTLLRTLPLSYLVDIPQIHHPFPSKPLPHAPSSTLHIPPTLASPSNPLFRFS